MAVDRPPWHDTQERAGAVRCAGGGGSRSAISIFLIGHANAQLIPGLVQCDERLPECTQCKRNKKKCPGAITDTFFVICSEDQDKSWRPSECRELDVQGFDASRVIDESKTSSMDDSDSKFQQHETTTAVRKRQQAVQRKLDPYQSPERGLFWLVTRGESPSRRWSDSCLLPSYCQPSRVDPFEQLFFSHFFETYGRGLETIRACSWLSKIPMLLSTSFKSTAMRYSTRAACMAFYGVLNGEIPIRIEARNYRRRDSR